MKTKYYQRNTERLQKDASERYKNHFIEEKIKNRKKAREKYQSFSEEEKHKKAQFCCESNKNLSEDQKQRLVKYRRNYYKLHNKLLLGRSIFKDPWSIEKKCFFLSGFSFANIH